MRYVLHPVNCTFGVYTQRLTRLYHIQTHAYTRAYHVHVPSDACEINYFMDKAGCARCPEGVDCESKGNRLAALRVRKGFYRTSQDSVVVYECANDYACQGGNTSGSDLCSVGYGAVLCSSCTGRDKTHSDTFECHYQHL